MGCLHFVGKFTIHMQPFGLNYIHVHTALGMYMAIYCTFFSQLGFSYSRKSKEDHICFDYLKILPVEFGLSLYVVLKAQKVRTNWL